MKIKELDIDGWQKLVNQYRAAHPNAKPGAAIRIENTILSTARHFGGTGKSAGAAEQTAANAKETIDSHTHLLMRSLLRTSQKSKSTMIGRWSDGRQMSPTPEYVGRV